MLIHFVDLSENYNHSSCRSLWLILVILRKANLNGNWPLTDVCLKCPVDLDTYCIFREVRNFCELTSVKWEEVFNFLLKTTNNNCSIHMESFWKLKCCAVLYLQQSAQIILLVVLWRPLLVSVTSTTATRGRCFGFLTSATGYLQVTC